jgi:hypothetical protein
VPCSWPDLLANRTCFSRLGCGGCPKPGRPSSLAMKKILTALLFGICAMAQGAQPAPRSWDGNYLSTFELAKEIRVMHHGLSLDGVIWINAHTKKIRALGPKS